VRAASAAAVIARGHNGHDTKQAHSLVNYRAARYFTAIMSNHVDPVKYCSTGFRNSWPSFVDFPWSWIVPCATGVQASEKNGFAAIHFYSSRISNIESRP